MCIGLGKKFVLGHAFVNVEKKMYMYNYKSFEIVVIVYFSFEMASKIKINREKICNFLL